MIKTRVLAPAVGLAAVAVLCSSFLFIPSYAQQPAADVAIDPDDIGGVVTGPNGPEAGVWVIAETPDLPVRYIKSVVTDDRGRFVVPDLPAANYQVWARGYGLVDSTKTTVRPGQRLSITALLAPNDALAARYYPAIYWYSMLKIPGADQFGGTSSIPARLTQTQWIAAMKNTGCIGCHQLGQASTRTIPAALGTFATGADAWKRRVQSGQSGAMMFGQLNGLGEMSFANYGDWTDRIAKGELPFAKPPRPQGVERNIVVTLRDWMNDKQYLHDLIASDRRFPTVNAYGPVYGSPEYSSDHIPILDPVKNLATVFPAPVRDPHMPLNLGPGHAAALDVAEPSPYWGSERIWETRVNNHNSMFGRDGRLWLAASVRGAENPAFCKAGSDHPSAKAFPMDRAVRHISVFDPKTKKYSFVDTCFSTHHLQFGYDANDTLWTSGGGPVVGWLNTKMFDQTGDAARSQGWTALVLDTNGNGKRDAYTEPDQPADPAKDTRVNSPFYAVMPSPADGSIWGATLGNPGAVVRLVPGANPPETALAEVYRVPMPGFAVARRRHRSSGRGVGIARQRPHGQLRPPQVQGAAQRAEGDRRSLSRRLVVPPVSRTRLPGHRREQRRVELLLVGRSAQHLRARQRRADVHRQLERRPHRLRQRAHGGAARAVPDGVLRQGVRRPHRRSERRLEGTRAVGGQRRSHAVAGGNGQGHEAAGRALPAAPGPVGEVGSRLVGAAFRLRQGYSGPP